MEKIYSYHQDFNYGVFYTPDNEDFGLLRQAIVTLLGCKAVTVKRETYFPQFFYHVLEVDVNLAEVIHHKLQLLGWERS